MRGEHKKTFWKRENNFVGLEAVQNVNLQSEMGGGVEESTSQSQACSGYQGDGGLGVVSSSKS